MTFSDFINRLIALDIFNLALKKLGEAPIDGLDTTCLKHRLFFELYHNSRMYTLCEAYWPFSIHTETVAPSPGGIHYHLPRPCLRIRTIRTETGHYLPKEEWRITNRILSYRGTPHKNLTLTYTANEEDVQKFTPEFIAAFVARLASKLSIPLLNSKKTADELNQEYQNLIEQQNNIITTNTTTHQ